jgi:hypothetical protein
VTAGCALLQMLRAGGPVQVPFRLCCVAALLEYNKSGIQSELPPCAGDELDDPRLTAAAVTGALR